MATELKLRRGTTSQHSGFTGAEAEVTVDTDKETVVVHDGSTAGGFPVAREDFDNVPNDTISGDQIEGGTIGSVQIDSADINGGTVDGTVIGGSSAADGSFTTLSSTGQATFDSVDINGGSVDSVSVTNSTLTDPEITGGIYLGGTGSANYLDDYEEGTWTVELFDEPNGGNVSPTTATGLYTKVGRVVFVQAYVDNISTAGMTGGNVFYYSLPFQVDSEDRLPGSVSTDSITFNSGRTYAQAETLNDHVRGYIRTSGSDVNDYAVTLQDLVSDQADFWFSLTYFTD